MSYTLLRTRHLCILLLLFAHRLTTIDFSYDSPPAESAPFLSSYSYSFAAYMIYKQFVLLLVKEGNEIGDYRNCSVIIMSSPQPS